MCAQTLIRARIKAQYAIGRTKVFMKAEIRNALTQLWNTAMKATVIKLQATVRMYLVKKRFNAMLPMYKAATFAAKGRDLKEITRSLDELESSDIPEVNPQFVDELRALRDFLEAQGRVLALIRNACTVKDLQLLKTAVEQTNNLRNKFPRQNHSQALSKCTAEAIVLVSELEEFALVKDLIKTGEILHPALCAHSSLITSCWASFLLTLGQDHRCHLGDRGVACEWRCSDGISCELVTLGLKNQLWLRMYSQFEMKFSDERNVRARKND